MNNFISQHLDPYWWSFKPNVIRTNFTLETLTENIPMRQDILDGKKFNQ